MLLLLFDLWDWAPIGACARGYPARTHVLQVREGDLSMIFGTIAKAIGIAIAATLLGSFILALGSIAYGLSVGMEIGLSVAIMVIRMPALVIPMFVVSLIEMLVILLPANNVPRQPFGALANILIGAAAIALLALLPNLDADKIAVVGVLAPYGAATGFLYWFAFCRRRPGATPAVT
jgi:hypothetical protein